MLNAITTEVTVNKVPKKFWIGATTILQLANWAVEDIPAPRSGTVGDGSQGKPWQMTGELTQWLQVAKALNGYTQVERYFWICGRFIKKFSKEQAFYVADSGGGWKMSSYAAPADASTVWGRTGNRPTDASVGKAFDRGGPSYRNIGNRLEALRDGADDVTWSRDRAKQLRKILMADEDAARNIKGQGHMTLGQTLPTVAAAMFLGEPGRNARAFLVNKMLLDMMEAAVTYGGRKPGSAPKNYTMKATFFRDSKTGGDPGDKGGKMPSAMTGSGEAGRQPISPDATKLANWKYTQAKEVTIICHALNGGTFTGTDEGSVDKRNYTQLVAAAKVASYKSLGFTEDKQVLGYLKYLMGEFLHSFRL